MTTTVNEGIKRVNFTIIPPGPYETFYDRLKAANYRPMEHHPLVEEAGQRVVCPCCGSSEPKSVENWLPEYSITPYGFSASLAICQECLNATMFNLDSSALIPAGWRPE